MLLEEVLQEAGEGLGGGGEGRGLHDPEMMAQAKRGVKPPGARETAPTLSCTSWQNTRRKAFQFTSPLRHLVLSVRAIERNCNDRTTPALDHARSDEDVRRRRGPDPKTVGAA